jgi:NifU-like protein involved in Fe-S cluster formation
VKDDLYHQAILDLAHQGTGHGRLETPQVSVRIDNPLCGDRVTLDLAMADGRVSALGHQVRGCLLCQAAAAVIGARAPGQSAPALRDSAERLRRLIVDGAGADGGAATTGMWPELAAFAPVHRYKSRHDCVLLPFTALGRALGQAGSD